MAKITNKKTGESYTVTPEQLKATKENPLTADLYKYSEAKEPEEVTQQKEGTTTSTKGSNKDK